MKKLIVVLAFLLAPLVSHAGLSSCYSGGELVACPEKYESVCKETFRTTSGGGVKYNCPANGGEKSLNNSDDDSKGNELDTFKEEKEAKKESVNDSEKSED